MFETITLIIEQILLKLENLPKSNEEFKTDRRLRT
jgi:hypothetical protein